MSAPRAPRLSRRQLLGSSAVASLGAAVASVGATAGSAAAAEGTAAIPFYDRHQAGVATVPQDHLSFATFDVAPGATRADVADALRRWTADAATLTQGHALRGPAGPEDPPADAGEATGLGPARLTITLGLGPDFFSDQLGNAAGRPAALAQLPAYDGDDLDAVRSAGALCVQACADNAQSAFAAVHELARSSLGVLELRAVQAGYTKNATTADPRVARDLLGFHRTTNNIGWDDVAALDRFVWIDAPDPTWLRGGTYLVARRIRITLEQWSSVSLAEQEGAVGRHRGSGAPLGGRHLHDRVDLTATGPQGNLLIPPGAHIRVASPEGNGGTRILRRGYTFSDGVDPTTGELDAGTFFIAFQRDPGRQFGDMLGRLVAGDALHRYLVHTSSGVFAVPRGLGRGEDWGSLLLGRSG